MTTSANLQSPIFTDMKIAAIDSIVRNISGWKTSAFIEDPSVWASENRYLPSGTTELPGKVDWSIAPHLVEIVDCFHPDSGIMQVSIMKSTQSLATTTLESAIGHAIKHKLHNILYIISSKNIARIRSSAAIDVMIDNSGLAPYVKPISQRMRRKVADNTFYKELHGGRRLMMTSWNSIGDAKSMTWSFIIMDELDEAPFDLKGQGDPEKIFAGRGKTVRNLKIAKISTPTNVNGRISVNFNEGDKRYWQIPCPHCGGYQTLDIKGMGRDYGLTARSERIDGVEQVIPDTVAYICMHCKALFYEYQKPQFMAGGKWVPTARPVNPEYRSYHISNLMSPVMFFSWTRCMQEFAETDYGQNITRFKNFCIDVMGLPWESRSDKKTWQEVKATAEDYRIGTIPAGGLVPTAGVDVQKRWLEMTVIAWGANMESWVIDHIKFHGDTADNRGKCWSDLRNYLLTKKYMMTSTGKALPILCTAVDCAYNPKITDEDDRGDGTTEHTVYSVVPTLPRAIACRGNDSMRDAIIKEERIRKRSPLATRFEFATSELKEELYAKLDAGAAHPARVHFSSDLSDDFFKGVVSEAYVEHAGGRWGWKKIYDRNEPLDTMNLARAAAERLNLASWSDAVWDNYAKKLENR